MTEFLSNQIEQKSQNQSPEVKRVNDYRRAEAEKLISEGKTVGEILNYFDNNYGVLEDEYRKKVGCELIADPYESMEHEIPITKSCSIVIPAYNKSVILKNCLEAIRVSTFNAKYPGQLEVIVVDDGSTKANIADLVKEMKIDDLNLKVYRQKNGGPAKARYSGVLHAENDIVITCDPDIVYTPNFIEEDMKRHQVLDNIVSFGFVNYINPDDQLLKENNIRKGSLVKLPVDATLADGRISDNGMVDCQWLKNGGNNIDLPIRPENGWRWRLSSLIWGLSVGAKREDFLRTIAGHDERYQGAGCEDEDTAQRLIALGNFVIPNTGGLCYHQNHPVSDSPENWQRIQNNRKVLDENIASPLRIQDINNPKHTDAKLEFEIKNPRSEPTASFLTEKADLQKQGEVQFHMGLYEKALSTLERATEGKSIRSKEFYWSFFNLAATKIAMGDTENLEAAISTLTELCLYHQENTLTYSKLAEAYGNLGLYQECLNYHNEALRISPDNQVSGLVKKTPQENKDQGTFFLNAGKPREALKYLNISIAQAGEGNMPWSVFDKAKAIFRIGNLKESLQTMLKANGLLGKNTWAYSQLGMIYEKMGKRDEAKKMYEEALKLYPDNWEGQNGLKN